MKFTRKIEEGEHVIPAVCASLSVPLVSGLVTTILASYFMLVDPTVWLLLTFFGITDIMLLFVQLIYFFVFGVIVFESKPKQAQTSYQIKPRMSWQSVLFCITLVAAFVFEREIHTGIFVLVRRLTGR